MNWNKVKTVIIVMLAAVNVFFICIISFQYCSNFLISGDMISNTVQLLENDNIFISADAIPQKKLVCDIYEGKYDDDYYEKVVNSIAGTDKYSSHMMYNGIKYTIRDTGDVFEFYDSNMFSIKYIKNGESQDDFIDDKYCEEMESNISKFEVSGNSQKNKLMKKIKDFLFPSGNNSDKSIKQTDFNINYSYYDRENKLYIVNVNQVISGYDIYSCSMTIIMDTHNVLYLNGNLMFIMNPKNYSTVLYDQINILFIEKNYLINSIPTGYNNSGAYQINELSGQYCINWNSKQDIFYLIPAWKIEYSDGINRIRNAVNGSIYTI